MGTETGTIQPPVKEHGGLLAGTTPGERLGTDPPSGLPGRNNPTDTLTSDFWPPEA